MPFKIVAFGRIWRHFGKESVNWKEANQNTLRWKDGVSFLKEVRIMEYFDIWVKYSFDIYYFVKYHTTLYQINTHIINQIYYMENQINIEVKQSIKEGFCPSYKKFQYGSFGLVSSFLYSVFLCSLFFPMPVLT